MLALITAFFLAPTAEITRPRDPWVFRSVLDRRARMVTLALHPSLWIAYDATNCGFYKAWEGGVAFEGAVYTAVHGPQPRSLGKADLLRKPESPAWFVQRDGGAVEAVRTRFQGYRFEGNQVVIRFQLQPKSGPAIQVEERPEATVDGDRRIGLERRIRLSGVPQGLNVLVELPGEVVGDRDVMVALERRILKPNAETVWRTSFARTAGTMTRPNAVQPTRSRRAGGRLAIRATAKRPSVDGTFDRTWEALPSQPVATVTSGRVSNPDDFFAEARATYDAEALYVAAEVRDDAWRPGDSVELRVGDWRGRFPLSEATGRVPEVVYRVVRTAGVARITAMIPWGVIGRVPKAGDSLPFQLSVTDDDGTGSPATVGLFSDLGTLELATSTPTAPEDQQPREPGLGVRVYWTGVPMEQLPELTAGQSPNVNFVSPVLNFGDDDARFGGFGDYFVVHATGYLRVPADGKYTLGLISDDGSKLYLDGKLVLDHDGLHGDVGASAELDLKKGEYPIRVEYFENEGSAQLRLGWTRPGEEGLQTIPAEFLSTPRGEVRVTAPGKKQVLNASRPNPAGDRRPLEDVHPSFDLATIRPEDFRPRVGGMDFLPDGRLVVCTWDADGAVYVLDGVRAGQRGPVTVKRIAAGLAEPLGLKTVGNRIFVLQKQELTELIDLNRDGVTDEYRAVANGWGVTDNFHEFAFGLAFKDGHFYANLATAINPGGSSTRPQNPDRGRVVKIGLNGRYEFVAAGLRTPNGIGIGYRNGIFLTDNQGDWLPSSKLLHLTPNAFFGNRSVDPEGTRNVKDNPPVVWLPQGEIGNSPSTPLGIHVGPYKGQMILGDVTYGGLQRVFVEEVNGVLQGAVLRMTQGLEAGVNRIAWGPDGSLYVGGIGSTGNWGQNGKERFGLQRLRYNGKLTFEMLAIRLRENGAEIEFTEPLAPGFGEDPRNYALDRFRYVPTEQYGGPKLDETGINVKSVTLSPDRKRAFLEFEGVRADTVIHVRLNNALRSSAGRSLWSTEAWYTVNQVPKERGQVREGTFRPESGFTSLVDPKAWVGYRRDRLPSGWSFVNGELRFDPKASDRGDIMSVGEYGDFELRLEWKVQPGGNSGIFFRVDPKFDLPWATGPEMQVLDDERHADGRNPLTSAGANYAMHPAPRGIVRPAGMWNEVRLIVRGNDVEHWLNGVKVVSYRFGSPEWEDLLKKSKFADLKEYGRRKIGRLVLQDHGDEVAYRRMRIRKN